MKFYFSDHAFKHGLTEKQIRHAWENYVRKQHRKTPSEDEILVVGYDVQGKVLEIVAVLRECGVLVYHAMTPPTAKFFKGDRADQEVIV